MGGQGLATQSFCSSGQAQRRGQRGGAAKSGAAEQPSAVQVEQGRRAIDRGSLNGEGRVEGAR